MSKVREAVLAAVEEHGFTGAIRVDRDGRTELAGAFGYADRALEVPNTVETRFGLASVCKGFTALAVVSLVVEGRWDLGTRARPLLGDDLPLIPDDVTLEHLLAHRSGIGDYLDEDAHSDVTDYVHAGPGAPARRHRGLPRRRWTDIPSVFTAGERFLYCNGGYVVLALLAERLTGAPTSTSSCTSGCSSPPG